MGHFGNTRQLTPVLDSLYDRSLAIDRVYATGNRTVRGLEAVTLSLPPCPGQSIIKRPNNAGMHSTGALLRDKGYTVKYFYSTSPGKSPSPTSGAYATKTPTARSSARSTKTPATASRSSHMS